MQSMRDQKAINEKIRQALIGKPNHHVGVKHTAETKAKIGASVRATMAPRLVSEAHKKARNKANVYAYRARKYNAVLPTSDMKLILKIYEHCPNGYDVDHKVSLSRGGPHHQDNLQYLPLGINRSKNADRPYDSSQVVRWQDSIPQ